MNAYRTLGVGIVIAMMGCSDVPSLTSVGSELSAHVGDDPCTLATTWDGDYCATSLDPAAPDDLLTCVQRRAIRVQSCTYGCRVMPPGQSDECNPHPNAPPEPPLILDVSGLHFTAESIRLPVARGVRYILSRLAPHIDPRRTVRPIRLTYRASGQRYCGGSATLDSASIYCPWNYPITGENQNYVMSITMHEIGHMLAAQLFGLPADAKRDLCENEGIASWIAGRYWMNGHPARALPTLKAAAKDDLARGLASLTMSTCVSASDAWYTVYSSFFEYLETEQPPDTLRNVASGAVTQWPYVDGWKAWMQTP